SLPLRSLGAVRSGVVSTPAAGGLWASPAAAVGPRRALIMTDSADRVEQTRLLVFGHGAQIEEDEPFLDSGHDGGLSPSQRPGPVGFRLMGGRKRGRYREDHSGDGVNGRAAAAEERLAGN